MATVSSPSEWDATFTAPLSIDQARQRLEGLYQEDVPPWPRPRYRVMLTPNENGSYHLDVIRQQWRQSAVRVTGYLRPQADQTTLVQLKKSITADERMVNIGVIILVVGIMLGMVMADAVDFAVFIFVIAVVGGGAVALQTYRLKNRLLAYLHQTLS